MLCPAPDNSRIIAHHFDLARHVRQKRQMAGAKPSGEKDVHHYPVSCFPKQMFLIRDVAGLSVEEERRKTDHQC